MSRPAASIAPSTTAGGIADDGALRAALSRTEIENGVDVIGNVKERHVAIGVEVHDLGTQHDPGGRFHAVAARTGHDVCVGDHVAVADRKPAARHQPTAAAARHLDDQLGGVLDALRVDRCGDRERGWQRWLEPGEHGRGGDPTQAALDAREEYWRARRNCIESAQRSRTLDLLRYYLSRAVRKV